MKSLVVRVIKGFVKVAVAFVPSLITLGIVIGIAMQFNLFSPPKGLAVNNTATSIDVVSQISEKAIQAAKSTVEFMQWIMVTFVIGGATFFWRAEKEVTQRIAQIQRDYDLVSNTLVKTDKQLSELSVHYHNLLQDLYDLPKRILPYEMAVVAHLAGKITDVELLESQAWFSWQKWYFADDATGYEELLAYKESGDGLPNSVVRTAITVLVNLLEKKKRPGGYNLHDEEKRVKLLVLLNIDRLNL